MIMRHPMKVIVSIMMVLGISMAVQAQQFGAVDLAKVNESLVKIRNVEKQISDKRALFQSQLDWMQENMMLNKDEYKEYVTISAAAKPDDTQKSRLVALKDSSKKLSDELNILRQKNPLTDTEKLRLNELTSIEKVNREYIQDYRSDATDQLKQFQDDLERKLWLDVKAAVNDVASKKKYTIVFSISPESVLYSSNDITEEVIKRLGSQK